MNWISYGPFVVPAAAWLVPLVAGLLLVAALLRRRVTA